MSCLFESLSVFLKQGENKTVSAKELRQEICNYLEKNPKILDDIEFSEIAKWESNMKINDYIRKMRMQNTWGGAIEIRCFCIMYNTNVVVKYNNKNIVFNPIQKSNNIIYLNYNGSHYTPII